MSSQDRRSMIIPTAFNSACKAMSFKTNVLVVGGSYAGLSAVKSFLLQARARFPQGNGENSQGISITLVEPRSGLLNVIGIPKAIVDNDFARSQYIPFDKLHDLSFDSTLSKDEILVKMMDECANNDLEGHKPNKYYGITLNYIHGKVTNLDVNTAKYELVDEHKQSTEESTIDFDYVVMATGRDRSWPTTPKAYTMDYYAKEMNHAREQFLNHDIVTIIGAGAVGIEMAGDIKHKFPNKTVRLIHAHALFPPEPLKDDFKKMIYDSLVRGGVEVRENVRVKEELENGDLITTNGETIKSSYNFWCNYHRNNYEFLSPELQKTYVTEQHDITINNYLQLFHEPTKQTVPHFFVLGDLVELPIIKSAGWAMYMGRQVANNIMNLIYNGLLVEPLPDLASIPRGMVLVGGSEDIVSELAGEVELNHAGYVQEYKDYCVGKVRATMQV